ncbi:MAG: cupin domain-containing protein [Lentisphaerae bacterium]|nr:cupin domain-containing protein [Lentisphaerota bacterium]
MLLQKFSDGECEVRPSSTCHFALPAGTIGRMSAGVVDVEPGGTNESCPHTVWRQVFFILEGEGSLIIDDDKSYPIEANMVCEIPYDAKHTVVASNASPLRYLFVNDYSQPVLKEAEEAATSYHGIESEVHADLDREP